MHLEIGGTVRYALDLAESSAAMGIPTTLLTRDDRDIPRSWQENQFLSAICVPGDKAKLLSSRGSKTAYEAIKSASIIHFHGVWCQFAMKLAAIARRADTPYVITVHGMLDDWSMKQKYMKKRLYQAIIGNRMYRNSAAMIVSSEGEKLQARKRLKNCRIEVLPPVLPLEEYRHPVGPESAIDRFGPNGTGAIDPAIPTVLFLSRLHYKKGVEHLISAAELLLRSGNRFNLVLAGTGEKEYEQRLETLIKQAGLSEVASLVGLITGEEKRSLYEASDLFVLPSHQENFGLVLTEALSCGTPVITTKGVDIWPELEASGSALIVDTDPERLANAMGKLLENKDLRESMGAKGRAWVLSAFETKIVAQKYLALYRDCSNPRQSP
ncbi:MAG: glycosyltransferase [Phycisphaerales bacterium]